MLAKGQASGIDLFSKKGFLKHRLMAGTSSVFMNRRVLPLRQAFGFLGGHATDA